MNLRKTSSCRWHQTSTVGIPSAHELCLEIVEFATGHGGTDAVGFANAIGVAANLAVNKFNHKVEAELQRIGHGAVKAEAV